MERFKEFLRRAIYWVSLANWLLVKLLDAIETFPKNNDRGGGGGSGSASVDPEKKPGNTDGR